MRENKAEADQRHRDWSPLHNNGAAGQCRTTQQAAHRLGPASGNLYANRRSKVSPPRIPQTMETRSLILSPDQYSQVSTYDLLFAAEKGFVGIDHRFLHAILDDPEKAIPDLLRFGIEERKDRREDLDEDLVQIFRH